MVIKCDQKFHNASAVPTKENARITRVMSAWLTKPGRGLGLRDLRDPEAQTLGMPVSTVDFLSGDSRRVVPQPTNRDSRADGFFL